MAGRALARAPDFCAAGCASGQGRSDGGDHGVRRAACSGFALSCAGCVQAPLIHVVGRRPSGAVQALQTEASSIPSCSGRWCALVCWTRCPARRALRLTRAGVCALAGSAALLRPAPQVRRPGGRQHPLSCVCVVLRTSRRHESSFASIEGALLVIAPALPAAHSVTPVLAGPPGAPAAGAEIWLLQSHGALPCGGGGDCGGAPCAAGQLQRVAAACDDHRCGRAHVHGSAAGVAFPRPASAALLGGRCSEASCRQAALRRSPGSTDRSASARRPAAVPGLCGRAS